MLKGNKESASLASESSGAEGTTLLPVSVKTMGKAEERAWRDITRASKESTRVIQKAMVSEKRKCAVACVSVYPPLFNYIEKRKNAAKKQPSWFSSSPWFGWQIRYALSFEEDFIQMSSSRDLPRSELPRGCLCRLPAKTEDTASFCMPELCTLSLC